MHLEKPLWPLVFHKWIIDGCLVSMCWYICFSVFRFMCHYSCLFVCLLVITVNRPLDYEQVPGGLIFLTLMARDGGNPSLNSTVPVTIELFVSTTPAFTLNTTFLPEAVFNILHHERVQSYGMMIKGKYYADVCNIMPAALPFKCLGSVRFFLFFF